MNDSSFIYQKKGALSKFFCDEMIKHFEDNQSKHSVGAVGADNKILVFRNHKNSIDLPIIMHSIINPLHTTLEIILSNNISEYGKIYPFLNEVDPYRITLSANIQKYNPTGGYVREHCEYGPFHDESNKRVLAWMFYLNDVTDKGGTRFPSHNVTLKARAGDLYIWPSYFTHSHHGVASPSQVKYIVTGWVDFIDS